MRYRPFAHHANSVSAITVALCDGGKQRSAEDWVALVYAALESGVNSFEIEGRSPAILEGLDRALAQVDRRLVFVTWRVGPGTLPDPLAAKAFEPQIIQATVQSVLARTRLDYLDLLLLDDPGESDLHPPALAMLNQLKSKGQCRFIGVAGVGVAIDAYISTGAFDCLALPYSMTSGWTERLRLRAAQERDMAVFGYDFCPQHLHPEPPPCVKRSFWGRRPAPVKDSPYAFLLSTPGWAAEEICLASALQEPSLCSIIARPHDFDHLQTLADATERSMPPGLAAQIEMARIVIDPTRQPRRKAQTA